MRRPGIGVGIFFLAAGVLFLLDALEVLQLRASFLLPLLLIGFGIALIAGGREPAPEAWARERERRPPPPPPAPARPEERTKEADEEGTAETPAEAEARPEDEEGSGPPPRQ